MADMPQIGDDDYLARMVETLTRYRQDGADPDLRYIGGDWPDEAETMIGVARLTHLVGCVWTVCTTGVPGDLIETGVWRGGACIAMKATLEKFGDRLRQVIVADSFCGLPPPDIERWPLDRGDQLYLMDQLRVTEEQVRANFARYGLLDDRVQFLAGWFKDTLPTVATPRLAVMRLDGDLYGSTMVALEALYPKLSPGGFCIIDDFGPNPCAQAVHDYRAEHGIDEPIMTVPGQDDETGSWWRKRGGR